MKKTIIFLLSLLLILSMVACSKDEKDPLIGTWKDKDRDTLTLNKDGTYESTHYYDREGTWKAEDGILTFKTVFDKEKSIEYKIENKEEKVYLITKEKDLIFGGDKETKFLKEK